MLVQVSDLVSYMDITFTNRQIDAAEMVLAGLQSEMETYLGRPIEIAEFTEEYVIQETSRHVPQASFFYDYSLDTTGNTIEYLLPPTTIYVRNAPIVAVEEILVTRPNGEPKLQVEHRDYVVQRYGVDLYQALMNDKVEITYTAGIDGSNIKMFKLLILRAATREMQNMHDDVVGVKDLNTRNVAPIETGFTEAELASLRPHRRRKIG